MTHTTAADLNAKGFIQRRDGNWEKANRKRLSNAAADITTCWMCETCGQPRSSRPHECDHVPDTGEKVCPKCRRFNGGLYHECGPVKNGRLPDFRGKPDHLPDTSKTVGKRTHKTEIEAIRKLVESFGGACYVTHQSGRLHGSAGVPDLILFSRDCMTFFEVKVGKDKLSVDQSHFAWRCEGAYIDHLVGGLAEAEAWIVLTAPLKGEKA